MRYPLALILTVVSERAQPMNLWILVPVDTSFVLDLGIGKFIAHSADHLLADFGSKDDAKELQ